MPSEFSTPTWFEWDQQYVWHPYSAMHSDNPVFPVESAQGVRLKLADGRELIDGMSSWWCTIHGYNHPVLNAAIHKQLEKTAHVMFGGLTHEPASRLAELLVNITPPSLTNVFLADSGSVAVEVAIKMAVQYWVSSGHPTKRRMLTIRGGYHGDTLDAMSVCDPVNGMHTIFEAVLPKQLFVSRPECRFGEPATETDMQPLREALQTHQHEIAAIILEPIVQGAGGMHFYSADYLKQVRALCDEFEVLLILDEIATGFGRTGKLFACEHSDIEPDILCLGKALTGGYMTLSATLTTEAVSQRISNGEPGVFMHGPTFMGNPLACSVALASTQLLLESPWEENVERINKGLMEGLAPCKEMSHVADVRTIGAIGVVELEAPVDMKTIQPMFVEEGVWVRPFGKLVYIMPPFIISSEDLSELTKAVVRVVSSV